ncbi:MAG: 4-diphosphocytidyl-2-C-methyl-D-erythritol kinase, partial [Gaiellaceae bacterium]|nr:4-diphosphocytidyl-2-C-methyl-D-erythritol kinase [Gaiellaceae bacterium]
MSSASAPAKLNLTLLVGPRRPDGKHEVATVLQRLALADRIDLEPAGALDVDGFAEDTIVRRALEALAERAGVPPHWHARITKEIPVAAGLGGGSSDAATALRLANATLGRPLAAGE